MAGRLMAMGAPCQNRSATRSSRKKSSSSTAPKFCGCGAASVDFNEDVRLSPMILTRLTEAYRKLRNTFRYVLGNLARFRSGPRRRAGDRNCRDRSVDPGARRRSGRACRVWYDEFAFHKVYRAVYDFATVDLSNIYFDVLKDRLYTSAAKSKARRSAQTALYRLAMLSCAFWRPILSFTAEEVWPVTWRAGQRSYGVTSRSLTELDRRHLSADNGIVSGTGTSSCLFGTMF